MRRFPIASRRVGFILLVCAVASSAGGQTVDPERLLAEADRLGWLRAWTRAESLYADAREEFARLGDKRNALYAEVSRLRGQLPTLPVPEVSERLSLYLDDPIVQRDERLRLRVLIIKGETDEDLDPSLSQRSWTEALGLSQKLGEAGWANRARGELGLVAFLQGDTNTAIVNLGQALKVAEMTGDTSSVVRWLTLFGHGHVELNRPEQAIDFYERALRVARSVPELQVPFMTLVGKADALVKLGRVAEAENLVMTALTEAEKEGSLGYQAELTLRLALIAIERRQTTEALETMARAAEFARAVGGNRILAGIAIERARILRSSNRTSEAETALLEGIRASRSMGERLMLPRLLAELADLQLSTGRRSEAGGLLREADDLLEGLLTHASSPWVRGRILAAMDGVVSARIRLEGERAASDPAALFSVLERARGRSLVDLLHARPMSDLRKPEDLRAGERRIASLQLQLLRTTSRAHRQRLLEQIFVAEEQLAPISTELFTQSRRAARATVSLRAMQAALRADEVLFEIALSEPASYALVITSDGARVRRLPGRSAILQHAGFLASAARNGEDVTAPAHRLSTILLADMPELSSRRRVIVSAEGALQQVPFELLPHPAGNARLLDTHVVSYTQSGSILAVLRSRSGPEAASRMALAVAASPEKRLETGGREAGPAARGADAFNVSKLGPLPKATEEARFVGGALDEANSTVLVNAEATEAAVKAQPLADYRVIHLAAHGIVSTKAPARSALLLRPSGAEDGLLQAREILNLRLNASLVTLSACDTSAGIEQGQDGVASLVRPFVAAGARAVVANLWAVEDTFSSTLMREFYHQLASGIDIGDALRRAKLKVIQDFGPAATPRLWSGVLAYGDTRAVIVSQVGATQ
jgi:CHAT domain-containing protein/tetratricopeptide (TPR) repeat protein